MSEAKLMTPKAWFKWHAESNTLTLGGQWTYAHLADIASQLADMHARIKTQCVIDCQPMQSLDLSGGLLLTQLSQALGARGIRYDYHALKDNFQHVLTLVSQYRAAPRPKRVVDTWNMFARVGRQTLTKLRVKLQFLAFLGEVFYRLAVACRHPRTFRLQYLSQVMSASGIYALPLIAFLSFLIGVVLAYQLGVQLRTYGANIFVVNLLAMSVLREFGPLMTAILVAGRSGSAFTAQIGTMIVRQEVDALKTMGLNPFDFLVVPRVLALILVLPLLTVWSEAFAMLGGMMMAKSMLNITFYEFLLRARSEISMTTYLVGLIKTPIFGLVIGAVGCFQGFKVSGSASSVGDRTTKSVVQALFLIIILDALFSIIFSVHGF